MIDKIGIDYCNVCDRYVRDESVMNPTTLRMYYEDSFSYYGHSTDLKWRRSPPGHVHEVLARGLLLEICPFYRSSSSNSLFQIIISS